MGSLSLEDNETPFPLSSEPPPPWPQAPSVPCPSDLPAIASLFLPGWAVRDPPTRLPAWLEKEQQKPRHLET